MGDIFYEQLIAKNKTAFDKVLPIGLAVIFILFVLVLPQTFGIFGLIIVLTYGILVYFKWWKVRNVEYEYVLVNSYLTIDGIYGLNRKTLVDLDLHNAVIIAPENSPSLNLRNVKHKKDFTVNDPSLPVYVILLTNTGEKVAVFFNPDETMRDGIQRMTGPKFIRM